MSKKSSKDNKGVGGSGSPKDMAKAKVRVEEVVTESDSDCETEDSEIEVVVESTPTRNSQEKVKKLKPKLERASTSAQLRAENEEAANAKTNTDSKTQVNTEPDPDPVPEYYPPIPKRKRKNKHDSKPSKTYSPNSSDSSPRTSIKSNEDEDKNDENDKNMDVISAKSSSSSSSSSTEKEKPKQTTDISIPVPVPVETPKSSPPSKKKYLPMEIYATLVASMSFLCIGLQRAYTSPAIASMKEDHAFFQGSSMSNTVVSWVAASPPLASFFGTIISGLALQYLGRQKTLVLLTLPYIAGWLMVGFAKNIPMLMTGRALTGLAAGFSTAAAPMYVSECVRAKVRGFLGFAPAMMLSLGILLGFTMSTINMEWRELALLMTSFPVLLLLLALALPESPSWLLYRGKEKAAMESLRRLRGVDDPLREHLQKSRTKARTEANTDTDTDADTGNRRENMVMSSTNFTPSSNSNPSSPLNQEIESEIEEMKRILRKRHSVIPPTKSSDPEDSEKEPQDFMQFVFAELLGKREIRFPAFISISLMVFQQFTGANAVIYYLSVILNEADPTVRNSTFFDSFGDPSHHKPLVNQSYNWLLDHNVCSVIFGLSQFFAFFLSLPLIDRLGRRVLLMVSSLMMIIPSITLGLFFWVKMNPNSQITIDIAHVYKYSQIIKYTSGWLPLMCLCAFIAAYSIGWGSIPYILTSEIFPANVRSYMVALASLVNHLTLFLIIRVFPTFMQLLGPHVMFWIFAVFNFLALIHVAIFVPETKGKTLIEIELEFKNEHHKNDKRSGKDKDKKNKKSEKSGKSSSEEDTRNGGCQRCECCNNR